MPEAHGKFALKKIKTPAVTFNSGTTCYGCVAAVPYGSLALMSASTYSLTGVFSCLHFIVEVVIGCRVCVEVTAPPACRRVYLLPRIIASSVLWLSGSTSAQELAP